MNKKKDILKGLFTNAKAPEAKVKEKPKKKMKKKYNSENSHEWH